MLLLLRSGMTGRSSSPGERPEVRAEVPEAGGEPARVSGREVTDLADAELVQPGLQLRTHAPQPVDGKVGEELAGLLRADLSLAIGLGEVGGDLRHELAGGDACRGREVHLGGDLPAQSRGDDRRGAEERLRRSHVEEGLVERERLG
jgi:hypothetical protein